MAKVPPPPPGRGPIELDAGPNEGFDPLASSNLWAERPEEREVDDFAARLNEATSNLEDIALGAIDGSDISSVSSMPSKDPVRAAPKPSSGGGLLGGGAPPVASTARAPSSAQKPAGQQAMHGATMPVSTPAPSIDPDGALELDLSRAGLKPDEGKGQALPAQARPGAIAAQAPKGDVVDAVAQGLPVPEASKGALARRSPGVAADKVSLFGPDPVLAWVAGAAIGLLVGVVPAANASSRLLERETEDLVTELASVVEQPLQVRAGTVRDPRAIQGEIESKYGPAKTRFFLVWLGIAVPITLALGLIRRSGS